MNSQANCPNTGRSSELHNYAVNAVILFKDIIKLSQLLGEVNITKFIAGAWWLSQNASHLLWKGWVTFNGITPHLRAHAHIHCCCVIRNVKSQHVRYINDTHSNNESTLNSKFSAPLFENTEDI